MSVVLRGRRRPPHRRCTHCWRRRHTRHGHLYSIDNSASLFYENVVPASTRNRHALRSAFDGLPVLESEGAIFEAARRPRSLVTNFAFARVPEDTQNIRLQDVLNPGAVALADEAGCCAC